MLLAFDISIITIIKHIAPMIQEKKARIDPIDNVHMQFGVGQKWES